MCRKLTSAELSEPDVILEIPFSKFDALPAAIRIELERYIPKTKDNRLIYHLPAYLVKDLEAMAAPQPAPAASEWQQLSLLAADLLQFVAEK